MLNVNLSFQVILRSQIAPKWEVIGLIPSGGADSMYERILYYNKGRRKINIFLSERMSILLQTSPECHISYESETKYRCFIFYNKK